MQRIPELVSREPWLAVSLSWLLPGPAHLLSGARGFGGILIAGYVFVRVINVASAISVAVPVVWTVIWGFFSLPLLAAYASWNVFRRGRTYRSANDKTARSPSKDPYLAVFLTLLVPGLGHAYLRKWFTSVAVFLGYLIAHFVLETTGYGGIGSILLRLLTVGYTCATCPLPASQHKKSFIGLTVLLLGVCLFADYLQRFAINRYFVSVEWFAGPSMAPTVPSDAYGVLDKFTYRYREPAVGEIIKFRHPPTSFDKESETAGKRIVAVGGETVQVRGGLVFVGGQLREFGPEGMKRERSGVNTLPSPSGTEESLVRYGVYSPYLVPEGHYFVLGDNRAHSLDSRCYGAIPRRYILGRVVKVWPRNVFSYTRSAH